MQRDRLVKTSIAKGAIFAAISAAALIAPGGIAFAEELDSLGATPQDVPAIETPAEAPEQVVAEEAVVEQPVVDEVVADEQAVAAADDEQDDVEVVANDEQDAPAAVVEEASQDVVAAPEEAPGQEATEAQTEALPVDEAQATMEGQANTAVVSYDYNAEVYDPAHDGAYPGVYTATLGKNTASADAAPTIGMPSIADANLADEPTTESPAIIQGAAVGYEEKTGATEYTTIKDRPSPYTDFKYSIVEEKAQDGTVHKKLTGFDGTYVIARLNVKNLFKGFDENTSYLHLRQDDNRALLVAVGMTKNHMIAAPVTAVGDFKAGSVYQTASYSYKDLLDAAGPDTANPYIDVVIFSSASVVSGADAGKEGALTGDIPLHFYVDNKATYNNVTYDPQSTDTNHLAQCLAKFWDTATAAKSAVSNYVVKGSDLALETMVANTGGADGTETTYWSLTKSFEKPFYDQEIDSDPNDPGCGRTVKMMIETAIVDNLDLVGTDANHLKKRTLDVNSFDIQVAKNSASENTGFTIKNAWLTLSDKSNTTGAEVAIGNNAHMVIDQNGKLIIDETCQLEVEWDGATTAPGQAPSTDKLNNGMLDLRAGGEIVNNGIITVEGTEGKPYQPGTGQQASTSEKGFGEFTIRDGATLTNNGSLMVYGRLYNLGTLVNTGKYDTNPIVSNDPDKGLFNYHRGIIISWKDDVTQQNVAKGALYNGIDSAGAVVAKALLNNLGDIVLIPGELYNYATLHNAKGAHIYLGVATEAIIPIEPDPKAPTVVTKRITLSKPEGSHFENHGTLINDGDIVPASVVINDNGSLGELTSPGEHPEMFDFVNKGTVINNGFIWGWGSADSGKALAHLPKTSDVSSWASSILALLAVPFLALGNLLRRRDF